MASGRSFPAEPIAESPFAMTYGGRNVIERCRLKHFRRIGTRYVKLARNYFSSACFVAVLAYWL
jgi:hypothetical protein